MPWCYPHDWITGTPCTRDSDYAEGGSGPTPGNAALTASGQAGRLAFGIGVPVMRRLGMLLLIVLAMHRRRAHVLHG
jgi:hypothetical protein